MQTDLRFLFVFPNASQAPSHQIGIALLSAIIKEAGFESFLFDGTFIKQSDMEEEFLREVTRIKPDVVGYSVTSTDFKFATRLQKKIEHLKIPAVAGGPHPTLAADECVRVFGKVLMGECELALPALLQCLEAEGDLREVPNLCYLDQGKIRYNPLAHLVEDMDALPFPDWKLFDDRHYFENSHLPYAKPGAKCAAVFERGRGCPHQCTYCSMPFVRKSYKGLGKWFRLKSVSRLTDEIVAFKALYPLDYLQFVDDSFLTSEEDLSELVRQFKKHVQVDLSISERPEKITREKMKLFKEAGGYRVCIGLESGDEPYRKKHLKRKMSNEVLERAFKEASSAGVIVRASTMVGLPEQDDQSYLKTYDLVGKLEMSEIQYTIFVPFVGTELYDYCIEKGYYNREEGDIPASFHQGSPLKMPGLSNRKIVRYQKLLYHMQCQWSPFKRNIVKFGGSSEVAFVPIFFFYMVPRILGRNPHWFKTMGIIGALKRTFGYYLTKNS